jgi:isoaspartyl peptidase/L-asparaginase-like protein (Ntn-hydrolase superfamily)
MSRMSDLDLMVQDGERTAEDFIARGFDARTARAMAAVVEAADVDPEPEGAFGHGPGCYGECDGLYDCSAPVGFTPHGGGCRCGEPCK